MTIAAGIDILRLSLDAAPAERQREAIARLRKITDGSDGVAPMVQEADAVPVQQDAAPRIVRTDKSPKGVVTAFEAVLLQTLVDQMLPRGSSGVFGSGFSGDVYRGMLCERLAAVLASRDVAGLARHWPGLLSANGEST